MIYTDMGPCLTRQSDGACIPKDPANRDYSEALATGTINVAPAVDPIPARIAAAWSAADIIASGAIDHNSREQFILWLIDPTSTPARKAAIAQCLTWMAGIWAAYATAKAQIQAGNAVVFSYPTPCPFTFWQVAAL